jgi:hypothetical protein
MIGRKAAVIGLALLSALLVCAFAAQGASAAAGVNTTAYTCVSSGGETNKDFSDAHCDNTVTPGTGKFEHLKIGLNTTTELEVTNEKTAENTTKSTIATLKGTLAGAAFHLDCEVVSGTGTIHNVEPEKNVHKVTGEGVTEFSKCKVTKPTEKCKVTEPVLVEATFEGVEGLNGAEKNMGVEFKAKKAENIFTEIIFPKGQPECPLEGKSFPVKGSVIATGTPAPNARESGGTSVFKNEKEMQKLELGGKEAEFVGVLTTKMKRTKEEIEKKEDKQNPITLTTPTVL